MRKENLSIRESILLRDYDDVECSPEMEALISDCAEEALNGQSHLVLNDETRLIIEKYKAEYLEKTQAECESLPKNHPPVIDLIIGLPGAGKSKIISKNEYMQHSFRADADKIKADLAQLLDCNINSPALHEISTEIRDAGVEIATSHGCNIVLEKVGKSIESIEQVVQENPNYDVNLRLIHCRASISRERNAMRFQKYNVEDSGRVARFVSDDFIKSIGSKPTDNFYEIVQNPEKRAQFGTCEAFIQETIFRGGAHVEMVDLYSETKDLNAQYEAVKSVVLDGTKNLTPSQQEAVGYKTMCEIYSTLKAQDTNRLMQIENGHYEYIQPIINSVVVEKNISIGV